MKIGRISKPAKVLPHDIRNNPFAEAMPITENDIQQAIYNLMNKGIVPKDVDISPAFERGIPPFYNKQARSIYIYIYIFFFL